MLSLSTAKLQIWIGILIYVLVLLLFQFYSPTANQFENTYLRPPASPGVLHSEFWNKDFWFSCTFVLLWLIPLTAAFMTTYATTSGIRIFHIVLVVLFFLYFMIVLYITAFDYANANVGTAGNSKNKANDLRWCCYYYTLPGSGCLNTAPCNPAVGPGDFVVNGNFLWQFWLNFVMVIFLIIDFIYVMVYFQPAVVGHLIALQNGEVDDPENPMELTNAEARFPLKRVYGKKPGRK
jgi:hypothetical protein